MKNFCWSKLRLLIIMLHVQNLHMVTYNIISSDSYLTSAFFSCTRRNHSCISLGSSFLPIPKRKAQRQSGKTGQTGNNAANQKHKAEWGRVCLKLSTQERGGAKREPEPTQPFELLSAGAQKFYKSQVHLLQFWVGDPYEDRSVIQDDQTPGI